MFRTASISLAPALLCALALALPTAAPANPATLAQGNEGDFSWTVEARTSQAGAHPCLLVSITRHHGPIAFDRSRFRGCLPTPSLAAREAPLAIGGAHLGPPGTEAMTVIAFLAPLAARQLRIALSDQPEDTIALQRGPRAELPGHLKLAVLAARGAHCVEGPATLTRPGATLWQGPLADLACASA